MYSLYIYWVFIVSVYSVTLCLYVVCCLLFLLCSVLFNSGVFSLCLCTRPKLSNRGVEIFDLIWLIRRWPLWRGWKNRMTTQNRQKSNT